MSDRPIAAAPRRPQWIYSRTTVASARALPNAFLWALVVLPVAAAWVEVTSLRRDLVAVIVLALVSILTVRDTRSGIVALFVFLPILGILRRLLIADAPWTSRDPLLLVAPLVVTFVIADLYIRQRKIVTTDRLGRLCVILGLIACVEVANPLGGGIVVGLGGLLFYLPPLMWFIAGQRVADRRMIQVLMYVAVLVALLNAAYGTIQAQIGLPSWDAAWLNSVGAGLVTVPGVAGSAIRPFGSLSSPQEYLAVLALGIVFSLALSRRRPMLLLAIPFLGTGLFLGSGRGQFLLAVLAIVTMISLLVLRGRAAFLSIAIALGLTAGALVVASPLLNAAASGSANPLVEHEASGLANPVQGSSSTLSTHIQAFGKGIRDGFIHPLGEGTGVATIAADTLGNSASRTLVQLNGTTESIRGTDVDVSNVFQSFGFVGGFIYVAIVVTIAVRLLRRYVRTRDPLLLGIIGAFVVMALQWLRGGLYDVSALTWFMYGWATRPLSLKPEKDGTDYGLSARAVL